MGPRSTTTPILAFSRKASELLGAVERAGEEYLAWAERMQERWPDERGLVRDAEQVLAMSKSYRERVDSARRVRSELHTKACMEAIDWLITYCEELVLDRAGECENRRSTHDQSTCEDCLASASLSSSSPAKTVLDTTSSQNSVSQKAIERVVRRACEQARNELRDGLVGVLKTELQRRQNIARNPNTGDMLKCKTLLRQAGMQQAKPLSRVDVRWIQSAVRVVGNMRV